MANICCTLVPLIFFSINFPNTSPISDPKANRMAISTFRLPEANDTRAPPEDTIARTPREVATMDFIGRSVNFFSEGTMTKPPPTPNKPDKKPAVSPAYIKDLAHGTVQINLLIDKSNWQGGGVAEVGNVPLIVLWACIYRRADTKIKIALNRSNKGALGILLATHSPIGDMMRPKIDIKIAAL